MCIEFLNGSCQTPSPPGHRMLFGGFAWFSWMLSSGLDGQTHCVQLGFLSVEDMHFHLYFIRNESTVIIAPIKSCIYGTEIMFTCGWRDKAPQYEASLPDFIETRNLLEELRTFSLSNLAVFFLEAEVGLCFSVGHHNSQFSILRITNRTWLSSVTVGLGPELSSQHGLSDCLLWACSLSLPCFHSDSDVEPEGKGLVVRALIGTLNLHHNTPRWRPVLGFDGSFVPEVCGWLQTLNTLCCDCVW